MFIYLVEEKYHPAHEDVQFSLLSIESVKPQDDI